jgi:hypothetical protein
MKVVFACALIVAAASVYYLGYMRENAGTGLHNAGSNSSTHYPSLQQNSETNTSPASDPRELAAAK